MIQHYRKSIIDCLNKLQKIIKEQDNSSIFELQMQVLRQILSLEKKIAATKSKVTKSKLKIKSVNSASKKAGLARTKEENKYKIHQYKRTIYLYRTIIDGIAFTLFDKYTLKTLSLKEPAGFFNGKSGLKSELYLLKELSRQGHQVVLNDLTTSLRYGDITVSLGSFPWAIEVKSSPLKDADKDPQIQKIKDMMKYLITDETQYTEVVVKRTSIHSEARTHTILLNELITQATINGFALNEVEPGLYYYVSTEVEKYEKVFLNFIQDNKGKLIVWMVNKYKLNNAGFGYIPFTLSISDPDCLIEFMEGNIIIMVMLDCTYVTGFFNRRGLKCNFGLGADYAIRVAGPKGTIEAGEHFVSRLAAEFVRLDWLLEELEARVNNTSPI